MGTRAPFAEARMSERIVRGPLEIGARIARRFMRRTDRPRTYMNDLALQGLLWLHDVSNEPAYLAYVQDVMAWRKLPPERAYDWREQLYVMINYELWLRTQDDRYIAHVVETADAFRKEVPRDAEGCVAYFFRPETQRIFIDMLQGYATHMARAGALSGDADFFDECVGQYRAFRRILLDQKTGWWSQGRGWNTDGGFVSPGAWLRGQGWVLRGMVESLTALPPEHPGHAELLEMLREFALTIAGAQDARGMWHQVPYRPETYQETTGTGFYLARAVQQDLLPAEVFRDVAVLGYEALQGFVAKDGTVLSGSFGCGPLRSLDDYLHRPAAPGDPHTPGTTMLACAGRALLDQAST
ncbi:MAG: glycoside hydrolase family 88 protein [Planctomycetota bacterium]|nr:glycoside hydrolase family 88 protein [Planctomycetota bacterium]